RPSRVTSRSPWKVSRTCSTTSAGGDLPSSISVTTVQAPCSLSFSFLTGSSRGGAAERSPTASKVHAIPFTISLRDTPLPAHDRGEHTAAGGISEGEVGKPTAPQAGAGVSGRGALSWPGRFARHPLLPGAYGRCPP